MCSKIMMQNLFESTCLSRDKQKRSSQVLCKFGELLFHVFENRKKYPLKKA